MIEKKSLSEAHDDIYVQWVDGIPVRLKRAFDLTPLARYGRVFKVFDDQDSGNLCFGMEKDNRRVFVKFAGAPTYRYDGEPSYAVARLMAALPIYEALHYETLVPFERAEDVENGYVMVFGWTDGECIGRMFPDAYKRFQALDLASRISVFRDVSAFLESVAAQGYAAVDFYDGSIMYDTASRKTTFCDIDCFERAPYVNQVGRMPGSSRFMSPEEFRFGAVIDEVTNVYTLGATAFALLAHMDRSREAWPLGDETYAVIRRAISDDRADRQRSISQLMSEWETALSRA